MRNIPLSALLVVIVVQLLLSLLSFLSLRLLLSKSSGWKRQFFTYIYWIYSLIIQGTFTGLFIYPFKASEVVNYNWYFIFNIVFIADLISKSILSISLILYILLRFFKKDGLIILYSGIILATGVILSVAFGAFFGKNQLSINNINLEFRDLPDSFDRFKIVQISDVHLGSFRGNQRLLNKIAGQIEVINPEVLVFTGDLVNNFAEETEGWKEIFHKIKGKKGKYAILGNHDYGNYYNWKNSDRKKTNFENITSAYQDFGFRLLRNETVPIINTTDTIYLTGVENWGHPPFPQYARLDSALQSVPPNSFNILLSHDPTLWEHQVKGEKNILLTLSGHTHGLQWGIKIAGIDFSVMYFGSKTWSGLYENDGQYLYVTRGIGTIGLNLRLDMPPEITVITLRKK